MGLRTFTEKPKSDRKKYNAKPIMPGGFHSDNAVVFRNSVFGKSNHEFFKALIRVLKNERFNDSVAAVIEKSDLMRLFGDVDADVKHNENQPTK